MLGEHDAQEMAKFNVGGRRFRYENPGRLRFITRGVPTINEKYYIHPAAQAGRFRKSKNTVLRRRWFDFLRPASSPASF